MLPEAPWGRLVGRNAEFARLLTLLDDAASGHAVVALIGGDAGVGKTRLVTEVTRLAAGQGFTVLSGHCAELGESVPYLPLADALHGASRAPGAAPGLAGALASRPLLGRLLPESGQAAAAAGDGVGMARQQMFGAVLGLLAELGADAPVLVVFEDLHWADASTRDLLTFLSRVLRTERVAIVGTYRTDDLHRRHPLRPLLAELQRLPTVSAIPLGPLAPAALAEHLTALAAAPGPGPGSADPGRSLDAAVLNGIITRAEGNAYYAEELLAASADRRGDGQVLPAGLAALLLNRVERLSDAAQRVLRAAAVAGRRADDELVRAASGLPVPDYEDAVREAVAQQLLVPDGPDGYAFRHALLREAVYGDLLPGERTRLHGVLAGLLADEERLAANPGTAAELAHHYLASHDIPGAFAASVRAGMEAERLGAPAEAHGHFDQALALWERITDPETLAGMERGDLALYSASNAAASGDVPRAVQQLRRLRAALAAQPDPDPVLVAKAGERLAYFLLQVDQEDVITEAVEVARAAIDALPADPPTWERARAIATYANTLLAAEDPAAADWAERGRAAARAAGSPSVEADSLVTLGLLSHRQGRNDEAITLFTAAHTQAREAGVLGVELRAATHLARAHLERGELSAAGARRARGSAPGRGDRAQPRAVRPRRAAPAFPGALRRRGMGPRGAAGRRIRGPGRHHPGGPAVGHGAVHRRGPRQAGGRRAPCLAGAAVVRGPVLRLHRARPAGRAGPVARGHRHGRGRGRGGHPRRLRRAWGVRLRSVDHPACGRGPERARRPGPPGACGGRRAARRGRGRSGPGAARRGPRRRRVRAAATVCARAGREGLAGPR